MTPHWDRAPVAGLAPSDAWLPQVSQAEPVRREGELWHIRAQAGLSVVAIMAVDIFFHYFYILTIPSDLKFASRLPDSALGGCAGSKTEMGTWGLGCHPRKTNPLYLGQLGELTPREGTAPIPGWRGWGGGGRA